LTFACFAKDSRPHVELVEERERAAFFSFFGYGWRRGVGDDLARAERGTRRRRARRPSRSRATCGVALVGHVGDVLA